ncbi:MAG: excinuclease ABC subunit UvrC [Candidatus Omnitrophica bacterium]|nr:excinuclease ABC subunit UvrC [Candidatus Omnitrophota bacterium]
MDIKEKLKDIPHLPGVYIMKDASGETLYIGKAKDLSKRVSSYFQESRPKTAKRIALLEKIKDLDYVIVGSEEEALIYEASLVKEKKPKYNVELKDDKSFPFFKLTLNEKFPRLIITRKKIDDGSIYFGPYTKVKLLRSAASILKNIFPLRICRKIPDESCLAYHIGQCLGPCVNKIDKRSYDEIVEQLILFLEGKKTKLIRELTDKMKKFADEKNFEQAAVIRNRLSALLEVSDRKTADYSSWGNVALKLKNCLRLPNLPLKIEAFDVSNISGKEATGSMVYFNNGLPDKTNYRKFRIKNVKGVDDYAMMKEIVHRRYKRLRKENKDFPDLIIIDGGKGHLKAAYEELLKLNAGRIPVIGIAKQEEKIYTLGSQEPLDINRDSEMLHFIQSVRDEAHRFALKYHHALRRNNLRKWQKN